MNNYMVITCFYVKHAFDLFVLLVEELPRLFHKLLFVILCPAGVSAENSAYSSALGASSLTGVSSFAVSSWMGASSVMPPSAASSK